MAQILNRGRPLQRVRDPWPIGADAPFDAPTHGTGGGFVPGSTIARKRIPGRTGSANSGNLTTISVMRAPAAFDQVQLILHVAQTNLPGSAVKLSVAPSAKAGYNAVTAADAAVVPTPVTWGGAGSVTVANAAASADGGVVESDYISDLMSVASLARADTPGALPLVHIRIHATSYVPAFSHLIGGPDSVTEPDYVSGTYSGDQTAAVLGAGPSNTTFHVPVTVVFYLRGVKVLTVGAAGDSTMQGSHNSVATAVDGSQNRWNGYHRQLKDLFVANGIPASIEQMCYHGEPSRNFHELARNALNNLNGAGLTHLMLYPFSVNDTQDLTNWNAAKARTLALIDLAVAKAVVPILVRNPPGYETVAGQANGYNAFLDQVAADGKAIVYDPRPPMGLAASGYPAMPDAGRLHDNTATVIAADGHPNNYFDATIAADMYAKRVALRMALA